MSKADSAEEGRQIVVRNRKARHEFHILDTWEAGLVLQGTEVKSLRDGKANLQDAYARVDGAEVILVNAHISPYEQGNRFNHDPVRPRKLLLHRQQIRKLIGETQQQGLTLVPLDIYFRRGVAKVTLALVRGKQLHDKRQDIKKRDVQREMARGFKE